MPRAFLITHKRYNLQEPGTTTVKDRESSPESQVNTAESFAPIQSRLPTQNAGRFHCQEEEEDEPLELTTGGGKQQEPLLKERWEQPEVDFRRLSRTDSRSDEFYNLTKLAEVSLAAAAGELFYGDGSRDEWTEQERPEDLSSSFADQKPVDVHACPECGKRYSTSSNLARHRQTHRSLADKKARTCPHCDKIYVSMPAFSMHVRTHNQGCKCSYCGKCFSRPWLLQGHIRTHTGEKPFKCTICGKAFADKSNLRAHVQTHSTMKPHICGRCGKAFALKSYLYKHEESSCMKAQLQVSDRKVPGQTKRFCSGRLKGHPLEKPILSIPTPVISVAIRV